MAQAQIIDLQDESLPEIFQEDKALAMFFNEWFENGGNASKAYKKLHPHVTKQSARVLGARQLAKVNIADLLAVGGFTMETYMKVLSSGLSATKKVNYQDVPDHQVRFKYFLVLGRLLGADKGAPLAQVNVLNAISNKN